MFEKARYSSGLEVLSLNAKTMFLGGFRRGLKAVKKGFNTPKSQKGVRTL
jgi:hypothetical protein